MLLRRALNHGLKPQGTFRDVLRVIAEPSLLKGVDHEVFLNLFKQSSLEPADLHP